jgi:hypothetical protein
MKTSNGLTVGDKRQLIYDLFEPQNEKVLECLFKYADKKYDEMFEVGIYCTSRDVFSYSVTQLICQTERNWDQSKYPNAASQLIFVFLSNLKNLYIKEIINKTSVKVEKDLYEKKLEELSPDEKVLIKEIFGVENFDPAIVEQSRCYIPIPLKSGVFSNNESDEYSSSEKELVEPCDPATIDDLVQSAHNRILYQNIIEYFNLHGTDNQKNVLEGMNSGLTEIEIAKQYNISAKRVNKVKKQIRSIASELFSDDDEVQSVYKVNTNNRHHCNDIQ